MRFIMPQNPPKKLLSDNTLEQSHVVVNCRMNRERNLPRLKIMNRIEAWTREDTDHGTP